MADWATVLIVLGTCFITNFLTWFLTKRQVAHSVKSEPLMKLRIELARMAAKGERVVSLTKSMMSQEYMDSEYQGWLKDGQVSNELKEAMGDWNTYMASGEFQQVLFMQYDVKLVEKVEEIKDDYDLVRYAMNISPWFGWLDEEAKDKEIEAIKQEISKNIDVIIRNRERIAKVQLEISKLLEKL